MNQKNSRLRLFVNVTVSILSVILVFEAMALFVSFKSKEVILPSILITTAVTILQFLVVSSSTKRSNVLNNALNKSFQKFLIAVQSVIIEIPLEITKKFTEIIFTIIRGVTLFILNLSSTVFKINTDLIIGLFTTINLLVDAGFSSTIVKQRKLLIKDKYPNLSIVNIMSKRKSSETTNNISILLLAGLGYYFLSNLFSYQVEKIALNILFISIILLSIQKFSFEYRIYSGLYGNNEREAREIIRFIVDEANQIDFTDNGKPKKIISTEDLEEIKRILTPSLNRG